MFSKDKIKFLYNGFVLKLIHAKQSSIKRKQERYEIYFNLSDNDTKLTEKHLNIIKLIG